MFKSFPEVPELGNRRQNNFKRQSAFWVNFFFPLQPCLYALFSLIVSSECQMVFSFNLFDRFSSTYLFTNYFTLNYNLADAIKICFRVVFQYFCLITVTEYYIYLYFNFSIIELFMRTVFYEIENRFSCLESR